MPKLYNSTNTQFLENFERGFTMGYTVAGQVVGATGAVGAQMIKSWKNQLFQSIRFATLRLHVLQEKSCNLKGMT